MSSNPGEESLEDLLHTLASYAGDTDTDSDGLNKQKKLLENKRYSSNTSDRQWLAIWSAIVSTLWLAAVIAILVKNNSCLHLSDTVIVTLLGTTTLNVLGIIFIVLRGHFQSKDEE